MDSSISETTVLGTIRHSTLGSSENHRLKSAFKRGYVSSRLPGTYILDGSWPYFYFLARKLTTSLLIATSHTSKHLNKGHWSHDGSHLLYNILWDPMMQHLCNIHLPSKSKFSRRRRKFPSWVNSLPSDLAVEDDWSQNEIANMVSKFCTFQTVTIKRMLYIQTHMWRICDSLLKCFS